MEISKKRIKKDKNEFRTVYDTYFQEAQRVSLAITRNRELAKEAVQETFIRVYNNIDLYDETQPFEPWFFRILSNECMRILKKEGKVVQLSGYLEGNASNTSAEEDIEVTEVYEEIQNLKDIYRIPIVLKYLNGFSEKEIANILELNLNTVKSRLYKGREQLKSRLRDWTIREGKL